MFFGIIIIACFIVLLAEEIYFLKKVKDRVEAETKDAAQKCLQLENEEKLLVEKVTRLENNLSERFLFYDLARKISPLLKKQELFSTFAEEIKHLGRTARVIFFNSSKTNNQSKTDSGDSCLRFNLENAQGDVLEVITKSRSVVEYMPSFVRLLRLCLERIELYDKLQELSIHDVLTKVYNRRHFMSRYQEEFQRAKKFKLNLAFLMIDIDHFKKINDNYGHLVGDAVLREVARIIRENMREIDFLARFGGEEFSIILPEADKASAIMAAERISVRVSQERIKVFDETLNITISVGVATFPQNTLHSDVLMEVADKALYKAKLSGRNRVCWF